MVLLTLTPTQRQTNCGRHVQAMNTRTHAGTPPQYVQRQFIPTGKTRSSSGRRNWTHVYTTTSG
eukprot:m.1432102 g.1432102  ORF g.1432102 m.1432102 type:complete len:64 (+) comp25077_c0_seq10:2564-2755(+)